MLQTAVHAPNTPPMTPAEQALSNRFDRLFRHLSANASSLRAGVRAAHALIIRSYLTHTGRTNWVHFNNIGNWGKQVVQRSAITEFCQYCNSITTAGYWHAFKDGRGARSGRRQIERQRLRSLSRHPSADGSPALAGLPASRGRAERHGTWRSRRRGAAPVRARGMVAAAGRCGGLSTVLRCSPNRVEPILLQSGRNGAA
jgi:hypothetical protein